MACSSPGSGTVVVVVADTLIQEFIFRAQRTGLIDCSQGVLINDLHTGQILWNLLEKEIL